jgi:hypothetical protein
MEIWKLFKQLPLVTIYVSNHGNVKSIRNNSSKERFLSVYNWGGKPPRPPRYKAFGCKINGKKKLFQLHRVVGELFITNPNDLPQINHKDGNPSNNQVENLEWCTNYENSKHYWDSITVDQ